MCKDKVLSLEKRVVTEFRSELDELARVGAQEILKQALEEEVVEYLECHQDERNDEGHRLVVRNGRMPARTLASGVGALEIEQPRVNDRRPGKKFSSRILPPFLRRLPSVDNLIPVLYLKGVSTGDFQEALEAILGEKAAGLSPTNIVRLKEKWKQGYEGWSKRSLVGKRYVYVWADGIYFNVRLGDDRPCLLVLLGAREDGRKELLAIHDGERESQLSWKEVLLDLKARGLKESPLLAVGDGALGFWAALEEVFPSTKVQRCWLHKMVNVLDKMPKKLHGSAKELLQEMYLAATKADALEACDQFMERYQAKFPKACKCLAKDKDVLFTFYDFPAEHWKHLRTTNPIESTFATVRHRTKRTKGCGSRSATLSMVFQLCREAEKRWRRLDGYELITKLMHGVVFVDGVELSAA